MAASDRPTDHPFWGQRAAGGHTGDTQGTDPAAARRGQEAHARDRPERRVRRPFPAQELGRTNTVCTVPAETALREGVAFWCLCLNPASPAGWSRKDHPVLFP